MNTTTKISKSQNGHRIYAFVIIGLLVIQYALGMVTNMFVQFPDTSDVGQLWEFTRSQLPSGAHMWVGVLLVLSAIIFVIRSAIKQNRSWIASSVVGLVAILTAFYGGVSLSHPKLTLIRWLWHWLLLLRFWLMAGAFMLIEDKLVNRFVLTMKEKNG